MVAPFSVLIFSPALSCSPITNPTDEDIMWCSQWLPHRVRQWRTLETTLWDTDLDACTPISPARTLCFSLTRAIYLQAPEKSRVECWLWGMLRGTWLSPAWQSSLLSLCLFPCMSWSSGAAPLGPLGSLQGLSGALLTLITGAHAFRKPGPGHIPCLSFPCSHSPPMEGCKSGWSCIISRPTLYRVSPATS